MPHDDTVPALQTLLARASIVEESINTAIVSDDNEKADALSRQFDELVLNILSFSTTSFADLKHKCSFGQKLIIPDHNDPEFVKHIFTKLIQDIERLNHIYDS